MKLNFLGNKTNVVSIYSWKHPELAIYDPNREEELNWMVWKMRQKLYGTKMRLINPSSSKDPDLRGLSSRESSQNERMIS
mgnify:CR=1 FL=1